MKTQYKLATRRSGVALVIVLSMLVLATGLIVAFFLSVTNDATSSTLYANDAQTKQFSDSVVNIVTGQIVEATKGFEPTSASDPSPVFTSPLAWASQPGAIRTFKKDGNADRIFKLYSSKRLVLCPNQIFLQPSAAHLSCVRHPQWTWRRPRCRPANPCGT